MNLSNHFNKEVSSNETVSIDNVFTKFYIPYWMAKEVLTYRLRKPPGSTSLPNNGWVMDASKYFDWVDTVRKTKLGLDPTIHKTGIVSLDGNRLTSGSATFRQGESSYNG